MKTILYDGWCLRADPLGAEAVHLATLLRLAPRDVHSVVALPAALPLAGVDTLIRPTPGTPAGRLAWEQFVLPALFRRARADRFHTTHSGIPLALAGRSVCSPAADTGFPWDSPPDQKPGGWARLRASLAAGAFNQIKAVLWPTDIPLPAGLGGSWAPAPPVDHPEFFSSHPESNDRDVSAGLPGSYVLVHTRLSPPVFERILAAWSWAAPSTGASTPLVIIGPGHAWMRNAAGQAHLGEHLHFIQPASIGSLASLYRSMTALLETEPAAPWGGSLRHALAAARPAAACAHPWNSAIAGPAAYLAPVNDARLLGAALLTLVVEDTVASQLSQAAQSRTAGWDAAGFTNVLGDLYS